MTYCGDSEPSVGRRAEAERDTYPHALEGVAPGRVVADASGFVLGLNRSDQLDDDLFGVTDDGDVRDPVLGDLSRVDVGVNDDRVRSESCPGVQ